jgi:hypothetical protein
MVIITNFYLTFPINFATIAIEYGNICYYVERETMGKITKQPVTIHDVARYAQVSYQTVSRVINGSPSVAEETRARVAAAIRDLGFSPNKSAVRLGRLRS